MGEHTIELEAAWHRHVADGTNLLDRLLGRYRERHRRYHVVDHVVWVIRHVDELAGDETVSDLGAVVAAAFYHDAIYEPANPANERASARLARRDLGELGWPPERAERVAAMIEATATHVAPVVGGVNDADTALLLDADLAILAADPAAYEVYTTQVRAEYHHLDDEQWRVGRRAVLQGLIDREQIYFTGSGRRRWEHHARTNIASELALLAA
jgi:predicted metal-dependent HD superfamily phosphohydrolase